MDKKKIVLMIDDDELHLEFAAEVLRDEQVEVVAHLGGTDALERVRALQPDLVLLDINMPDVSGTELARQFREDEKTKNIPIVFYSGKDGASLRKLVSDCNVLGYICKGNIHEFRSRIKHYLAIS